MADEERPSVVIIRKVGFYRGKTSIVRGASVRQIRDILTEGGFKEEDVRIQGVDVDALDQEALRRIYGGDQDLEVLPDLPIVVSGIGTRTLRALLKQKGLENVRVMAEKALPLQCPGDITCSLGYTIALEAPREDPPWVKRDEQGRIQTIALPPVMISHPLGSFLSAGRETLLVEGITRYDLARTLVQAGFDLDRVHVRPLDTHAWG